MLRGLLKKRVVLLVLLLLGSLFGVTAVSADTLTGTGWIEAHGSGVAGIKGNIDRLTINGNGTLYYHDGGETDIPEIHGIGRRVVLPNGWVKWVGFQGSFHLENADHVTVVLHGRDIDLYAFGTGSVWLRGVGTYTHGRTDGLIVHGTWRPLDSTGEISLE